MVGTAIRNSTRCAGRPAQRVLFRIAVPTTPVQTASWSIPITIHPEKIIVIDNLAAPQNPAEVRHIMGMVNYCVVSYQT